MVMHSGEVSVDQVESEISAFDYMVLLREFFSWNPEHVTD